MAKNKETSVTVGHIKEAIEVIGVEIRKYRSLEKYLGLDDEFVAKRIGGLRLVEAVLQNYYKENVPA